MKYPIYLFPDPATGTGTFTATETVRRTRLIPRKDDDIVTVSQELKAKWAATPVITLIWMTSANFGTIADNFKTIVLNKKSTAGSRSPLTDLLDGVDAEIEDGVREVKTYIAAKFGSLHATANYAPFGIVHEDSHWVLPRDHDQRSPALQLMIDAIEALPPHQMYPALAPFYLSMAKEAWQQDAAAQLTVIPQKLAKNWLLPGNFDVYTRDTTGTRGLQLKKILSNTYFKAWHAPYKHAFYMAIHLALLTLIIIGIVKINRHDRFRVSVFIVLAIFVLYTIPFCGLPRWHTPIWPLLILAYTPDAVITWMNKVTGKVFGKLPA